MMLRVPPNVETLLPEDLHILANSLLPHIHYPFGVHHPLRSPHINRMCEFAVHMVKKMKDMEVDPGGEVEGPQTSEGEVGGAGKHRRIGI